MLNIHLNGDQGPPPAKGASPSKGASPAKDPTPKKEPTPGKATESAPKAAKKDDAPHLAFTVPPPIKFA